MKNLLYLASQSSSRAALLQQVQIPFIVWPQSADEQACDWTLPLEQLVTSIALHKIESLDFGSLDHIGPIWVLTADTLGQDTDDIIYGKPQDYADAVRQLKSQRDKWVSVATAFCVDKKNYKNGVWITEKRIAQTVTAQIYFSISDAEIEEYIRVADALRCAGSITVDGFGAQYLKALQGSYSAVIGLPLYEVKQALKQLDFF